MDRTLLSTISTRSWLARRPWLASLSQAAVSSEVADPPQTLPSIELRDAPAHLEFSGSAPESLPPARRRRISRGAIWVVLSRSLGIGVTMLVNVALARWLSPDDFGSYLLLSSVLALASLFAMVGFNAAIVRFVSEAMGKGDYDRARGAMRLILSLALLTVASVAGLAALALEYFDSRLLGLPDVQGIVPMAATSLVLLALIQLLAEACRSIHEMRLASLFSGGQTGGLLSNLLFLMLIAAAVVLGKPSFFTAVALNLVAMCICAPLAAYTFARASRDRFAAAHVRPTVHPLTTRQLLAFSLPMLLIQLLTFATTQADLWIAGICWPHDQLALYGAARRLVLLVTMPLQMANLTVLSSIAELYGQDRLGELQRVLRSATTMAAWPSIGAIAVLILFGGPILELLFGPYFRQAALPLGILGVGQLFLVWAGGCNCALEMTGHQTASLIVNFCTAVALVAIGSWAAIHLGIIGLSVVSASVIAAQSLSLLLLARKHVGVWTHGRLFFLS